MPARRRAESGAAGTGAGDLARRAGGVGTGGLGGAGRTGGTLGRIAPGRVGEVRRRNPGWLLAGVLIVVLSALGGVLLLSSADERHPVLVAATDLQLGQPVERSQLRVVQLSGDAEVATLGAGDVSSLVGQVPIGPIPAGAVLHPAMFDRTPPLGAGEMVFGAALQPGEAPLSSVTVGTPVRLLLARRAAVAVAVADPGVDGAAAVVPPEPAIELGDGVVWGYEQLGSGDVWVSVRTTTEIGLTASKAAQDDELRIVVVAASPAAVTSAPAADTAVAGADPAAPDGTEVDDVAGGDAALDVVPTEVDMDAAPGAEAGG